MNKALPLLVTLCAALLLSACGAATTGSDPVSAPAPGDYVAVARGQVGVEGGLLQVRAAVPGLVKAVAVATNAKVAAGQTLVRLDDDAAQIAVQLAGADLAQARAQQAELVAGQPAAELRAQRLAAAAAADAASGQELAEARAALGELRARVQAAAAAVQAAQARLDAARHQLALYTVHAPVAGYVARRLVQVGARVDPDDAEPLLELLPERPLIVRAELNEAYADKVRPGMRAEVVLDAGGGRSYAAHVLRLGLTYGAVRLGPQHEQPDDARDLECVLQLDAPGLRVGQRVRVQFLPETVRMGTE
ncbi:HlyD family efflux transporter periplasmic adaptor subunit [Metallibacterium sp.]|uniref:HlyD family efflux transporter periplasmic adaptor subunit n=1 Tax=Metallibacterium sp. TaxID=2940281 RepID=UPI00262B05E2|nr:HlyD family efflux transporter periplasmic adaptor subunit [Metallibacterium sp.]